MLYPTYIMISIVNLHVTLHAKDLGIWGVKYIYRNVGWSKVKYACFFFSFLFFFSFFFFFFLLLFSYQLLAF